MSDYDDDDEPSDGEIVDMMMNHVQKVTRLERSF